MEQNSTANNIILYLILFAVILAASFINWGAFINADPALSQAVENSHFLLNSRFPITGWKGSISLFGIQFPNWLLVTNLIFIISMSYSMKSN